MDIKSAIWDKRFQELFPEHEEKFKKTLKSPGCACNIKFLRTLMKEKERLQKYFPTKEIKEEEAVVERDDYVVVNCPIDQLQNKLKSYPKKKRIVAAARWKDSITVILNDISAIIHVAEKTTQEHVKESEESHMNWKVLNSTTEGLIDELKKLPDGRKTFALTRWDDQITLIVNDLNTLF